MPKKPIKGSIKWLKKKLDDAGVTYDSKAKKGALEKLYAETIGGGGGGGGGGGAVTAAAASAGVSPGSPSPGSPSPGTAAAARAASPKQTRKATEFLKSATKGFGKVATPKTLKKAGKPAEVRVSPPKGNKTKKAPMDIDHEGTAVCTGWKKAKTPPMFTSRVLSPVSPSNQRIVYTNNFSVPVKLATSMLPPGFNPRPSKIANIPGHNYPLDPGTSIGFDVRKGNTIYVYDGNFNPMETLCTKAGSVYGPDIETRYVPTEVPNVKSNFQKGAITPATGHEMQQYRTFRARQAAAASRKKSAKKKKGGRRRKTRRKRQKKRRRTHRKRRKRRTRRGGEWFGFRKWVKGKLGYTTDQKKKEREEALKRLRQESEANLHGVINNQN